MQNNQNQQPPSAMVANFNFNSDWYPYNLDTTSFHVTGESQNIQQLSPFEGPDQIYIGNGQGLPIHSTGSSTFISPINS